ncbi:hypothetical protein RJ55_06120 [Drechmeria coniospora]|nr:hypothetical protein RJ55_06120 [Drechmeria coniospora]
MAQCDCHSNLDIVWEWQQQHAHAYEDHGRRHGLHARGRAYLPGSGKHQYRSTVHNDCGWSGDIHKLRRHVIRGWLTGFYALSLFATQPRKPSGFPRRPSAELLPETHLPDNANYPWGGDSPVHRHQNVTELGEGIVNGKAPQDAGTALPRRTRIFDRLKILWQGMV